MVLLGVPLRLYYQPISLMHLVYPVFWRTSTYTPGIFSDQDNVAWNQSGSLSAWRVCSW